MPKDELRQRRGDLYDPEDAGAIVYLWRSDKAQVYQIFGAEEAMTKGYGVWAKKAKLDKLTNSWKPDTIPAQRAKEDVAQRRAIKMALKIEFSLDSLLAATPSEESVGLEILSQRIHDAEMDQALPAARHYVVEEDGDILFEPSDANATHRRNKMPEPEPDDGMDDAPSPEDVAVSELTGQPFKVIYAWGVSCGGCVNEFEAKNSWAKIRDAHSGLSPQTGPAILREYVRHQLAKAAAHTTQPAETHANGVAVAA
jgi:hypothetical protein